ncbi:MAG: type I pullulanase, partial [Thermoanaerobaculia bacterium]|nr:type I pullulanase [Thermoanaerobaculia bacterium]
MSSKLFLFLLLLLIIALLACRSAAPASAGTFAGYPEYTGSDLGMNYSPRRTVFKLWAPSASAVRLRLFAGGESPTPEQTVLLKKGAAGVWETTLEGDQKGHFYTVQVEHGGRWLAETPDPYAKAVGTNGRRGQIIDLAATNPPGWAQDKRPAQKNFTDIVLYELHVRDASIAPNSGIRNKGKYLGLTETGTKSPEGLSTGLDHLKALGVTHVHLLPVFDFRSVDESRPQDKRYNWGYDPENYNVPEGSYSTNPADGATRIREFKQMVQALHTAGIRVVMDVVYNHTGGPNDQSVFNRIEPGYYYRQKPDGSYSDASACGNETASERPMMRRFMLESMKYWVQEYRIDGFRVDLMGIHDIETMNRISAELHAIDPTIFIYGEGWTAGSSPLPDSLRALKANTWKLDRIAAFSDDVRDAIKGHVFTPTQKGFVSGNP